MPHIPLPCFFAWVSSPLDRAAQHNHFHTARFPPNKTVRRMVLYSCQSRVATASVRPATLFGRPALVSNFKFLLSLLPKHQTLQFYGTETTPPNACHNSIRRPTNTHRAADWPGCLHCFFFSFIFVKARTECQLAGLEGPRGATRHRWKYFLRVHFVVFLQGRRTPLSASAATGNRLALILGSMRGGRGPCGFAPGALSGVQAAARVR